MLATGPNVSSGLSRDAPGVPFGVANERPRRRRRYRQHQTPIARLAVRLQQLTDQLQTQARQVVPLPPPVPLIRPGIPMICPRPIAIETATQCDLLEAPSIWSKVTDTRVVQLKRVDKATNTEEEPESDTPLERRWENVPLSDEKQDRYNLLLAALMSTDTGLPLPTPDTDHSTTDATASQQPTDYPEPDWTDIALPYDVDPVTEATIPPIVIAPKDEMDDDSIIISDQE